MMPDIEFPSKYKTSREDLFPNAPGMGPDHPQSLRISSLMVVIPQNQLCWSKELNGLYCRSRISRCVRLEWDRVEIVLLRKQSNRSRVFRLGSMLTLCTQSVAELRSMKLI